MGELELLSFPFTHSLVLRINESGNRSWSPKVSEKALRTSPGPGDGSGHLLCARSTAVGSLLCSTVNLCHPLYGKSTMQEKSLSAQPAACSCWKICTDLIPFLPSTAPSSPGRCRDTNPSQHPGSGPCGGSRDPPLMPPPSSHLATHWGSSLCQHHPGFYGHRTAVQSLILTNTRILSSSEVHCSSGHLSH